MVILKKEQKSDYFYILNQGKEYSVNTVVFYDDEGAKYEYETRSCTVVDEVEGNEAWNIDISKKFSKAKVKRKEDFRNNEIFITKKVCPYGMKRHILYLPLSLVPFTEQIDIVQDEGSAPFYKDVISTDKFSVDELKEGITFNFSETKYNEVFLREVWRQEKVANISDLVEVKKELIQLKSDFLKTKTDEEAVELIEKPLFSITERIGKITKERLKADCIVYDENDDTKIVGYFLGSDGCNCRIASCRCVFSEDFSNITEFYHELMTLLDIQLIHLEFISTISK